MPKQRIIRGLLFEAGLIVKTTKFRDPKYMGYPNNTSKIFNKKHDDEIYV